MSALKRYNRAGLPRVALVAALLSTLPLGSLAQTAPASSSSSAPTPMASMPGMDHAGMDHGSMPGMTMPATPAKPATPAAAGRAGHAHGTKPAAPASLGSGMSGMHSKAMPGMHPSTDADKPAAAATAMPSMPGMTPEPMRDGTGKAMPVMDHATMSGTDHGAMDHGSMPDMGQAAGSQQGATSGMSMDSMQGGSAPADARSPDYSDGVGYGSIKPHMDGKHAIGMLLFDQLEGFDGRNGNGQSFELSGWYGQDLDKLWLRSEGDVSHGKVEGGDVEALWNHAISTYWGTQLGVRHDLGAGPGRDWLAFGVEGLAPYWFTLEATGYVEASGRTAARLRANYEVLFTQRLILEPELEFNLYGKDDPARRIGSGLSDVSLGLRLRYEIRREFAPYIGINWVRRVGTTADYARADGQHVFDQQLVAGIRIWF